MVWKARSRKIKDMKAANGNSYDINQIIQNEIGYSLQIRRKETQKNLKMYRTLRKYIKDSKNSTYNVKSKEGETSANEKKI